MLNLFVNSVKLIELYVYLCYNNKKHIGGFDMSQLFEDKIIKIEKLMKIMLTNATVDFSYGDVEGTLDEFPFSQLLLSAKKSIDETLLDLHISNENGDIKEIAEMLEEYGVTIKDNHLEYPPLDAFTTTDLKFCLYDIVSYTDYLEVIEEYLTDNSVYGYAIALIYAFSNSQSGVSLKEAIENNRTENGYLMSKEDALDEYYEAIGCRYYYWAVNRGYAAYGAHMIKYADDIKTERQKRDIDKLIEKGKAQKVSIGMNAGCFFEDICLAFYESKGKFNDEAFFKDSSMKRWKQEVLDYISQGYEGGEHLFKEDTENDPLKPIQYFDSSVRENVTDKINKNLFLNILLPEKYEGNFVPNVDSLVSGYMALLKMIIEILSDKREYDIPESFVSNIIDNIYARFLKASFMTTLNLYTRKGDALIKKGELKEKIRKDHSIANDRWNRCNAFYIDELFEKDEIAIIAKYIPKMNEILELM